VEVPVRVGNGTVLKNVGKERAYDAVCAYAHKNLYDPLADLLRNNLPDWDGQDHITELSKCIKHSMPSLPNGADPIDTYLRKWLVGAVATVLRGEQNFVPILIGAQNQGKSTVARWLSMDEELLFSEAPIDPDAKESVLVDAQVLIHEIPELGALTRIKDGDALKRYLTTSSTDVRLPYAKTMTKVKHRASYIGTSNPATHLLRDLTGNRRFVALRIDGIDWSYKDKLDPRQNWAQAVALFEQGWDYKLTDEEKEYQEKTNASYEAQRMTVASEYVLQILEQAIDLHDNAQMNRQLAINLPESLLKEYLRTTPKEDNSFASAPPAGVVNGEEIAIHVARVAALIAQLERGETSARVRADINSLIQRVGGQVSQKREVDGNIVRCAVLTIEQARSLVACLSYSRSHLPHEAPEGLAPRACTLLLGIVAYDIRQLLSMHCP